MMNEPVVEQPAAGAPGPASVPAMGAGMPPMPGGPGGAMPDINPQQLVQMLQGLPEEQRAQAAQSMGMSVEQLQQFTTVLSSLPPEQLQTMLGSMGGMGG